MSQTTTAGAQVDPFAFSGVALRPIPVERSYGLTAYQMVTDEKEILANPDLQVFRDEAAALKHLNKGARAPAGCARVFPISGIPRRSRKMLPLRLTYGNYIDGEWRGAASHVVTDLPVIVTHDPKVVYETLRNFDSLPVLTSDEGSELLKDALLVRKSKSKMWGLPTIGLRKLTKKGKERKTPGETIRKQMRQWMEDRHCLNPNIHKVFVGEMTKLLSIHCGLRNGADYSSDENSHRDLRGYHSNGMVQLAPSSRYVCFGGFRTNDPTWSDRAERAANHAATLDRVLVGVLEWEGDQKKYAGDIRSAVVYLHKHKRKEVLELLSLYAPVVKKLYLYPEADRRVGVYVRDEHAKTFRRLGVALHRLAWKMGCRTYPALDTKHLTEEPIYESV